MEYIEIFEIFKKATRPGQADNIVKTDIKWFCNYQTADELTDMGTKDIAQMLFSDGKIEGIDTNEDVVEFMEDYIRDCILGLNNENKPLPKNWKERTIKWLQKNWFKYN